MRQSRQSSKSSSSRHRWTAVEARAVLAEQQASGLSSLAFARRKGLSPQRLYWWRQRLEAASLERASRQAFVEVTAASAGLPVEVIVRSGRVLRVPASIDPEVLLQLVEALEKSSPC